MSAKKRLMLIASATMASAASVAVAAATMVTTPMGIVETTHATAR